jgi:hypothetical protein
VVVHIRKEIQHAHFQHFCCSIDKIICAEHIRHCAAVVEQAAANVLTGKTADNIVVPRNEMMIYDGMCGILACGVEFLASLLCFRLVQKVTGSYGDFFSAIF